MKAMEQLNIFDIMADNNKPEPQFKKGDIVFVLELDIVLRGTIDYSWICGSGENPRYYGYSVDLDGFGHTTIWDYQIGEAVFNDESAALAMAESKHYDKLTVREDMLKDFKCFEYKRSVDGYRMQAAVGKIGDTQLYEHNYMCYRFVRQYQNAKKRDEAYKSLLKRIFEDTQRYQGVTNETYEHEALYMVTDELYASRGYAIHNRRIKNG